MAKGGRMQSSVQGITSLAQQRCAHVHSGYELTLLQQHLLQQVLYPQWAAVHGPCASLALLPVTLVAL